HDRNNDSQNKEIGGLLPHDSYPLLCLATVTEDTNPSVIRTRPVVSFAVTQFCGCPSSKNSFTKLVMPASEARQTVPDVALHNSHSRARQVPTRLVSLRAQSLHQQIRARPRT